ncbi:hypothetical protein [Clostridium tertium]|uniref:hypothetical protein n=1 Tax=Clostridium tertium TaxID=1559 RepID=UPI0012E8E587
MKTIKPIKAVNVNAPNKESLGEFHKILAKSLVRRLGIDNSKKLLELSNKENTNKK